MGAIFAALLGLAFGSFLNVCLSRLPEGESVVSPRSHCRTCNHNLAWWENLPLISWIILRGRCHGCRDWIGLRYPLVELAVGLLWTGIWLKFGAALFEASLIPHNFAHGLVLLIGFGLFTWLLVALAALDAEYFWLPDWITLPGIALGFLFTIARFRPGAASSGPVTLLQTAYWSAFGILAAAGIVLAIRLAYWLVRRKEGMGLGDAKLMAMLAAWLGLPAALESFALAILAATGAALIWLAILSTRRDKRSWKNMPLPLGTFLCLGALTEIFSANWLWTWWQRHFLFFS